MANSSDIGTLLIAIGFLASAIAIGTAVRWLVAHTNIGERNYSEMDPDEMVTIARSIDPANAYKWQAIVKNSGIRCIVTEPVISHFRGGAGIDPTYNVEVRAADAERALRILETAEEGKLSNEGNDSRNREEHA